VWQLREKEAGHKIEAVKKSQDGAVRRHSTSEKSARDGRYFLSVANAWKIQVLFPRLRITIKKIRLRGETKVLRYHLQSGLRTNDRQGKTGPTGHFLKEVLFSSQNVVSWRYSETPEEGSKKYIFLTTEDTRIVAPEKKNRTGNIERKREKSRQMRAYQRNELKKENLQGDPGQ